MSKLSISNIGWSDEWDDQVFSKMKEFGFDGLEIAPTRVFPEKPYSHKKDALRWSHKLQEDYGFTIPSMQSIWYGRSERIFGTEEERYSLVEYTQKAIEFAENIGCKNLVFGCPKNRIIPDDVDDSVAVEFFKVIGDFAALHNTVVSIEANPPIYNTNYINTTIDAFELIKRVDSPGFLLNLDVGTMIENQESIGILKGKEQLINHVHISEPGLKNIQKRKLHNELAELLRQSTYSKYISIEMSRQSDINTLFDIMKYVKEIFG